MYYRIIGRKADFIGQTIGVSSNPQGWLAYNQEALDLLGYRYFQIQPLGDRNAS